jgi:hypothetical protein
MSPDQAEQVRDVVARERGTDEPFDLCVWGPADQADAFEAAGVTWFIASAGPDDPVADVRRRIAAGPPR